MDEAALVVARDRCEAYGVDATLKAINGQQLLSKFSPGSFDFIIYFACLEHMTIAERLEFAPASMEPPNIRWNHRDYRNAKSPLVPRRPHRNVALLPLAAR